MMDEREKRRAGAAGRSRGPELRGGVAGRDPELEPRAGTAGIREGTSLEVFLGAPRQFDRLIARSRKTPRPNPIRSDGASKSRASGAARPLATWAPGAIPTAS